MNTATTWKYLAPKPKSVYQHLFATSVNGGRISARTLYGWYAGPEPLSPAEIAQEHQLPVEAVLEAIAYCESNPLQDYARDEALMEASGMNDPDYRLHPTPRSLSPREIARIDETLPG